MTNDALYNQLSNITSQNTAQSQEFAREEMKFNAEEAQKNRDWQAQQSSTAHQREVADLQKAGLNPVLSAGGSGAQTGSGATASGASGKVDDSLVPALTSIIVNQQNNATQQAIASQQREATLEAARISANTQLQAAAMAASASRFNAQTSAYATQYAADKNYKSNKYSADTHYKGTALTAKTSRENNATSTIGGWIGKGIELIGKLF